MTNVGLLGRLTAAVTVLAVPAWTAAQTPSTAPTAVGAAERTRLARATATAPPPASTTAGATASTDVRRLGGTTRFYKGSLATAAGLRRMSSDPAMAASMRKIMSDAGVPDLSDELLASLSTVEANSPGVACVEARPQAGTVVECDVRPGESLEWMVFRPGGGAAEVKHNVRWAGREPFRAYLVRLNQGDTSYTFVVPKECGNLSLLAKDAMPRVAAAAPAPPPPPPPPAPAPAPVAPPPPPPPAPAAPAEVQAPVATPEPPSRGIRFFADGTYGKERRVRPLDDAALIGNGDGEYAQCTPLVGVTLGAAKRFANDWELAAGAGVAFSVVTNDDKVREHALFAEAEVNKWIGRSFVGGGLGLWDITRSDTLTPTAMVHVGLPIADQVRFPVYFLVEGRMFFDNASDIDNNYQFWGGIRVRF